MLDVHDDFRKAMRQGEKKGRAEAVLSCLKLVVNTKGVFSIVVEQIDRRSLSSFLDDLDASLHEEIMETFDKFNAMVKDVNSIFTWADKEEDDEHSS